jgi:hypothetical protein
MSQCVKQCNNERSLGLWKIRRDYRAAALFDLRFGATLLAKWRTFSAILSRTWRSAARCSSIEPVVSKGSRKSQWYKCRVKGQTGVRSRAGSETKPSVYSTSEDPSPPFLQLSCQSLTRNSRNHVWNLKPAYVTPVTELARPYVLPHSHHCTCMNARRRSRILHRLFQIFQRSAHSYHRKPLNETRWSKKTTATRKEPPL